MGSDSGYQDGYQRGYSDGRAGNGMDARPPLVEAVALRDQYMSNYMAGYRSGYDTGCKDRARGG